MAVGNTSFVLHLCIDDQLGKLKLPLYSVYAKLAFFDLSVIYAYIYANIHTCITLDSQIKGNGKMHKRNMSAIACFAADNVVDIRRFEFHCGDRASGKLIDSDVFGDIMLLLRITSPRPNVRPKLSCMVSELRLAKDF